MQRPIRPIPYLPELAKISVHRRHRQIEFDDRATRKNAEITIFTQDRQGQPIAVVQAGKSMKIDEFMAAAGPAASPAPAAALQRPAAPAEAPQPAAARRPHQETAEKKADDKPRTGRLRKRHRFGMPFLFSERLTTPSPWTSSSADHQRPDAGLRVRRRGAGLHDGLRHHPAHQLRPRRGR